jgi:hypothetical protein
MIDIMLPFITSPINKVICMVTPGRHHHTYILFIATKSHFKKSLRDFIRNP